jgi:predicted small lipoprotein YifL
MRNLSGLWQAAHLVYHPGEAATEGIAMQKPMLPLSIVVAGLLLAGCGQKGPLFLPGDPGTLSTQVPAQTEPPQDDDETINDTDDENDNP